MSNTTIATPAVQSTEFDYSTVGARIASILDNSKDFYQCARESYLAVKGGAVAATLAKSISSTLAKSHKDSTIKSIAPATLGYRIAAYKFIVENELPESAATVNKTYTLVSKTSGVKPGLDYLPSIVADFRALPKSKQTGPALLDLIEAANDAAKPSAKPRVTAPKTPEEPATAVVAVQSTELSADDFIALVRANVSRKWSNEERRAIASVLNQAVVALRK